MNATRPVESIDAGISPSLPSQPRRRLAWYHLYFALAGFDLLTVATSLYLSHHLNTVFEQAVTVNADGLERLAAYEQLGRLASAVNAPGNDVFDTRDVPTEREKMTANVKEFTAAMDKARDRALAIEPGVGRQLHEGLAQVELRMTAMLDEARSIFAYFEKNEPARAGERMATMDRRYAELLSALGSIQNIAREDLRSRVREQAAFAQNLRTLEFLMGGAIVLMVAGITFYGHRLSGTMRASTLAQAKYTVELEELSERLKAEIVERQRFQAERDRMHQALMDASRQAGMAEISTGVLHNVGNAVTGANVIAESLADKLTKSRTPLLTKAVSLISEHQSDLPQFLSSDARGRQLPELLTQLAEHLNRELTDSQHEIGALCDSLQHVKEIVVAQQSFAKGSNVIEQVELKGLVEQAISLAKSAIDRHRIEIRLNARGNPAAACDRSKVQQVVMNLLLNAKDAIRDSEATVREIRIDLGHVSDSCVYVEVADSGGGIPADVAHRMFSNGFTTKADGHGFGLHYSALAIKGMGGTLEFRNDPERHGAVFRLELPVESLERRGQPA